MIVGGRDLRQAKAFRAGTHRSRSPAETLAAYGPLASSMGITRLAGVTGLDNIGLPVYVCVRPAARALSTSQGKGVDVASAKASALMESIESWHAERIELAGRHDTARHLARRARVVDIARLPTLRGARARDDVPMWWVEGWDLLAGAPVWVPYEAVSLNFVHPPGHRSTFVMSSNGLASGNHALEAIVHGLLEVLERDADARWAQGTDAAIADTAIDLERVDDPLCLHVLSLLRRAGVRALAHDITGATGVPAYRCTVYQDHERWRPIGPAGGMGCHLAPEVALVRALTEAVQSRVTMIAGSRDDLFYRNYAQFESARAGASVAALQRDGVARALGDRPSLATDTFEDDLETLLAACRGAGATAVVVVDLTREDVGIPVWKVIVPGFAQLVTA